MKRETQVELRATEYRADGVTPSHYDVVRHQAPVVGWDDAPITSPVAADRLPRVQHVIHSDAISEARGFNIRVSSLAAVLGGGVVLAALIFGASLSFWGALMWFGSVFALTWAAAFALDAFTSAGGIELFHAWHMWQFLKAEQNDRFRRMGAPDKSTFERVLLAIVLVGAMVSAVAFTGIMVGAILFEGGR